MTLHSVGLRTRLLVLVLCAVVPAFALNAYTAVQQRSSAARNAQAEAFYITRLIERDMSSHVAASQQLLHSLSLLQEVKYPRTATACNKIFAKLVRSYPFYTSLGVATLDGNVWCTSRLFPGKVNIVDRKYFRLTLASHDFSVGGYIFGRVTGKHALNFGYPIMVNGELKNIMYTGIDLGWVEQALAGIQRPRDSVVYIVDADGLVLAGQPTAKNMVGKPLRETALVRVLLDTRREGTLQFTGTDGIERIFAYAPLPGTPGANIYIAVGLSTDVTFATANKEFQRNVISLSIAALLAALLVWFGTDAVVLRRIKAMAAAAKRFGEGDLGARTRIPDQTDEIGRLATTFDQMMGQLQEREQRLRENSSLLETEVQLRTQELLQARDLAVSANRHKSHFLATVSHELRTPLQAIMGYTELVLKDLDTLDQPDLIADLELVMQSSRSLLTLIENVLDFAKIEEGRMDVALEAVDVDTLAREVTETIAPLARRGKNRLHVDIACEQTRFRSDRNKLRQILLNLLSNACKFTRNGDITLSLRGGERELVLSVIDTGSGIAPSDQPLIFEAFRQVGAGASHPGGTGLGLAIVNRFVSLLDGTIDVESNPGIGSTFTIRLPLKPD